MWLLHRAVGVTFRSMRWVSSTLSREYSFIGLFASAKWHYGKLKNGLVYVLFHLAQIYTTLQWCTLHWPASSMLISFIDVALLTKAVLVLKAGWKWDEISPYHQHHLGIFGARSLPPIQEPVSMCKAGHTKNWKVSQLSPTCQSTAKAFMMGDHTTCTKKISNQGEPPTFQGSLFHHWKLFLTVSRNPVSYNFNLLVQVLFSGEINCSIIYVTLFKYMNMVLSHLTS